MSHVITGEKVLEFKGENSPQTPATLFSTSIDDPLALDKFRVIEGAAPSYNNWCDVDRLLQTMTHLSAGWKLNFGYFPYVSLGAKHGNSCGAAVSQVANVSKMVAGDTRAIFGGVIMVNFKVDSSVAYHMAAAMPDGKARFDGVIAPGFDDEAIQALSRAKGKCRLMVNPALGKDTVPLDMAPRFRYVRGGFLVQPAYTFLLDFKDPEMKVYGDRNHEVEQDLLIAWGVGCTSNSNTITIVKDGMLIGNGVGQQDRVGAANLTITRARRSGHDVTGAAAYSDSFFPFPDGPKTLIDAGVTAIFTSSGSVKDQSTIDVCAKHGVALYMVPDQAGRGFFGH